jgi:hypothetical protein
VAASIDQRTWILRSGIDFAAPRFSKESKPSLLLDAL